VIALDAYALVALLADEPARGEVEALLKGPCLMSTINLAESLDVLTRVYGVDEKEIRELVGPLAGEVFAVEAPQEPDAWSAASLRRRHYRSATHELSLADCFLLATALRTAASIATADPAVASTARAEAVDLVALPDSAGRRP
jgi:PIN domain nuclease of toxin-antitoxin system